MQDPSADIEIIEDEIKKTFHKEIIEKIEKILVPKLTFFVGAGISKAQPSKLPLFEELNKEIIRSATTGLTHDPGGLQDEEDYTALSNNIRPEIVLRIFTDILPQELMYKLLQSLEKIMNVEPNLNHLLLAQALKQGGWVFTTNYDNLIEKACSHLKWDVEKRRCVRDEDFDEFREKFLNVRDTPGGYLFKLHGSIEDPESILATLQRIGNGLADSKKAILKYFFQNFNFCFMGYSCRDDFDILPMLLETPSAKGICWFQYAEREIGAIIWGREILQYEKEKEENKPLGEMKNWETINVNKLLKTGSSFKVIGDSSEFVEQTLWRCIERESIKCAVSKGGNMREQLAHWATEISEHDKNLIAGLLFHYIESFDKAEAFFKKSEGSAQKGKEKAIAQRWQADTYYRKETYQDAIEILTKKTLPLCEELSDIFMVAQIKTDIANNLRRLKNFPDALKYVRDAKELFENRRAEFIKGKSEEEHELEYARCLNILGLVYYGRRDPSNPLPAIEDALRFCEESRKIRECNGDISMAAESDNAVGLILYEQAKYLSKFDKEKAIQLLKEKPLKYLEKALDKKERVVGDYRGCQQCYRNLGLVYDLLAELVSEEEKEKYLRESLRVYEEEANYMRRMLNPPKERFSEVMYRLGMRHLERGTIDKSIALLREVTGRRTQPKDWHDKARALNGLREAYEKTGQKEECKECCFAIKSIYQGVLTDNNKLKEIKDAKIKFENATKEILPNTKNSLERIGLTPEAEQVDDILEELKRKITAESE